MLPLQRPCESIKDELHRITRGITRNLKDPYSFLGKDYFLEENWDVIIEKRGLTKKEVHQQCILWEFITTEKTHIKRLRIIVHLFQEILRHAQMEGYLSHIDESKIFANIDEVLETNEQFWNCYVFPLLIKTREKRSRIIPSDLLQYFKNFSNIFKPYVHFCLMETFCVRYIERNRTRKAESTVNMDFLDWVQWCESLSYCDNLKLTNLLKEPRIRFMRYPFLFGIIRENTTNEYEKGFLDHLVNISQHFVQRFDKGIEVVTCLNQFEDDTLHECELDLCKGIFTPVTLYLLTPLKTKDIFRCLLDRSSLRMIDSKEVNTNVEVFLFSDVLLIAKMINKDTKRLQVIRPLYFLERIRILKSRYSSDCVVFLYLDSFGLLASTFTFQIAREKRDEWMAVVNKAKVLYEKSLSGKGSTFDFFKKSSSLPTTLEVKPNRTKIYYASSADRLDIAQCESDNQHVETNRINSIEKNRHNENDVSSSICKMNCDEDCREYEDHVTRIRRNSILCVTEKQPVGVPSLRKQTFSRQTQTDNESSIFFIV